MTATWCWAAAGSSERLQKPAPSAFRCHIEYFIVRAAVASLARAPRHIAEVLARWYVSMLDRAVPRLRRTARQNLSFAFPEKSASEREKIIDGVFRSIARLVVAFARFPQISRQNISEWIRYEGLEHFANARARGQGVLFATAHFGNWELSAFAHGLLTEPMNVMVRPLDNPKIDALVEHLRTLSGNRMIAKQDAARDVLKALKRNEAVGILVDQNTSIDQGVFVKFFGVPACAGTAFAKLAARSGAAVIPGFAIWLDNEQRYVLRFYPPIEISGDAAVDTHRIQAQMETVIREHPDQWLWVHRRWKTRPRAEMEGGPSYATRQ